jgi:hypothetical protein
LVLDRLHVCDHGKYLLAYIDNGQFLVLDGKTYQTQSEIAFRLPTMSSGEEVVLNSACAASAGTAVFELVHAPSPNAAIRVFELAGGRQVAAIDTAIAPGRATNIDVSPSGTFAAIVAPSEDQEAGSVRGDDLQIVDLQTHVVTRHVHTDMVQAQAVFVNDSEIALASGDANLGPSDTVLNVFDIRTGGLVRRLTAEGAMVRAPIAASADGRSVMGYTANESLTENALQIKNAHFTIWDRETGKVIAQSPELYISKTSTKPLDLNPWSTKNYVRPEMSFSPSGNAVVVTGYLAEPTDVYTLK